MIIGIDLGTTTTEVAFYNGSKSEVIKNLQEGDSTIIPSVVLIEGDEIKVGVKAKNQMILKPNNTIIEIKKLIGKDETILIDSKVYTPVEITSFILKKVKEVAEFYIGEEISEAVITVPANFDDKARRNTKKAGELAGLKVDRIINEPTAAAIAYGVNNIKENMNVLVYDFGGGTLDVTILELFNGILDVKVSRGDNCLGGKDIDEIIMNSIIDKFYKETGVKLDLSNKRIISTLKSASEDCKKNLSFQQQWDVIIPYIAVDGENNPIDLNIKFTQDELRILCREVIRRTEVIIENTLKAADLKVEDINKIILAGGSSRLPFVKEMILKKFDESKIVSKVNPEEIVAMGAAVQGAIKERKLTEGKEIIVVDTCSHSLGVEVLGENIDIIIERDSKLPAKVTKRYKTVEDNQDEAIISIYEGDSKVIGDNIKLDDINIKGIPKSPKGNECMDITFQYDLNGILNVDIEIISTGKVESKKVKGNEYKEIEKYNDEENVDTEIVNNNYEYKEEDINRYDGVSEESSNSEVNEDSVYCGDNDVDKEKEEIEDGDAEEEDYSTIFAEVAAISKYVNANINNYEGDIQKNIRTLLQDLLVYLKRDDFKECRNIEHRILEIMGIE